jgi:hypothetical protein
LIAWDLYSFNWIIQSKSEVQKTYGDALAQLVHDRKLAEFIKSQPGKSRVHFDVTENVPNIGNAYGAPVTWAMSATLLMDYAAGIGYDRQRDLLSVRYTVRRKSKEASEAAPVYSDDVWDVYENPNALPRAWVVHRVEVDPSLDRPLKRVLDPSFDPAHEAIIERPLETPIESESLKDAVDVRWITDEPGKLELDVAAADAGLLVLGEVFYPGWTATVDDSPATIYRANGLLRAVQVPKGMHRVVLRYEPASVRWGALLTVLTFLGVCGAGSIWGQEMTIEH